MNCIKREGELIGYLINVLSDEERKNFEIHLGACPKCERKLKNFKRSRGLLHAWDPLIPPSDHERIKHKIMDNIKAQKLIEERISKELLLEVIESEKDTLSNERLKISQDVAGRMVRKRRAITAAIAAVIVIALMSGINIFTRKSTESIAWANMIKKIEKIRFYKFQQTTSVIGSFEEVVIEKADVCRSADYGILINRFSPGIPSVYTPPSEYSIREYGLLSDNTFITVYPKIKKYTRYILPEKNVYRIQEFFDIITYIKMISSFTHKKLDSKIIDGKKVAGFEIIDPKFGKEWSEISMVHIWIDMDTNLPVLYEYLGMVASETRIGRVVLDQFEWHEKGDEEIFEPDLSEYQLAAEVEVGPSDEGTSILALQRFSEIAKGRYPRVLAKPDALYELNKIYKKRAGGKHFYWEEEDFEWEDYAFLRSHLETTCMFYGELFIEYEGVAYHGEVVTADDPDLPLLRWKISDDTYRVLFGDLSIKDVSETELANLEADLNTKN